MNQWIWHQVSALGWWWWFPPCVMAGANLVLLSGLNAPLTRHGRLARFLAWMAHIPMLFVGISFVASEALKRPDLALNALGTIALPLMILANTVLYYQLYLACRVMRKEAVTNHNHWTRRALGMLVE